MTDSKAPLQEKYSQVVPNAAANADAETAIFEAEFDCSVVAVEYIPDTAITGANTESRTVTLYNRITGDGTTKIAELEFTLGADAHEFTDKAIPLYGVAANQGLSEGEVVSWKSLHVGSTGLADPGGTVVVTVARV